MTVSITVIGVGTAEGDGTGDKARLGAQSINTNQANFKAAIEELQGRHHTIQNASVTVALGKRYMCNNHAAITLTLPATFAVSATDFSDLQIVNADDASDVTITPASGDALFVDGATLGVDTSKAITPGNLVILSPRTTDSEWDLIIVGGSGGGGWTNMTEAVWAGGTQSEVADGATAIAFDYDTDNAYTTAGAKLASWSNNSTEKAYIDKDGNIWGFDRVYPAKAKSSNYIDGSSTLGLDVVGGSQLLRIGSIVNSVFGISPSTNIIQYDGDVAADSKLMIGAQPADSITRDLIVAGQAALPTASTNLDGGDVNIVGGAGASSSAGDADGGDVNIDGGQEYGTGTIGNIIMASLPTSDPTIAGALWNNSNVLTVSAG